MLITRSTPGHSAARGVVTVLALTGAVALAAAPVVTGGADTAAASPGGGLHQVATWGARARCRTEPG